MGVEALVAFVQERAETNNVPGLWVAVAKDGHMVWERRFGFADFIASTPATPSTSYLRFTMTKFITATSVMRLAETGSLDLDDPPTNRFLDFSLVSGVGEALISLVDQSHLAEAGEGAEFVLRMLADGGVVVSVSIRG